MRLPTASYCFDYVAHWIGHLDLLYGLCDCVYPRAVQGVVVPSALNRRLFEKAVSFVGTDPKSSKLWDNYIMFETSCVCTPSLVDW